MSTKLQAPKGFEDILPADSWKWQALERIARETSALYHFDEIRTPVLEQTALFHRGVGETSDIVHKETFTFLDRGNESMTLRPEGTAGVVRAAIEHNLIAQEGSRAKVFYIGSNFRYERPQKGRLRQHHQFGAESFGVADPAADVECILLQLDFYKRCGVKEFFVQVNSLGDAESKKRFRDELVSFLTPIKDKLSDDSQRRLVENPLRILDSKDPRDKEATFAAPAALASLSPRSLAHFEQVKSLLYRSTLGANGEPVRYHIAPNLVRGFDYYTETLWEIMVLHPSMGAQNAIGGGGRYDNLVEMLGGRPTPGVGFGSGLERLLLALEAQGVVLPDTRKPLVWLVYESEPARAEQWKLLAALRAANISADMDHSGRSIKAQFKMVEREKARWVIKMGDPELAAKTAVLTDRTSGEQSTLSHEQIISRLK